MSIKRLRIHVAIADGGERLHAEKETIEKPVGAGSPGDAVWVDTIKNGKEKIQADINSADKQSELWPTQSEQPPVDIAPLPGVGVDLDEFDLAGSNRNFSASSWAKSIVHKNNPSMWPFKNMPKLAGPEEFPAIIDSLGDKLRSREFQAEADRLHYLVHEMVCTTSSELYGELSIALRQIQRERSNLPVDITAEIRRLMKSINSICRWR